MSRQNQNIKTQVARSPHSSRLRKHLPTSRFQALLQTIIAKDAVVGRTIAQAVGAYFYPAFRRNIEEPLISILSTLKTELETGESFYGYDHLTKAAQIYLQLQKAIKNLTFMKTSKFKINVTNEAVTKYQNYLIVLNRCLAKALKAIDPNTQEKIEQSHGLKISEIEIPVLTQKQISILNEIHSSPIKDRNGRTSPKSRHDREQAGKETDTASKRAQYKPKFKRRSRSLQQEFKAAEKENKIQKDYDALMELVTSTSSTTTKKRKREEVETKGNEKNNAFDGQRRFNSALPPAMFKPTPEDSSARKRQKTLKNMAEDNKLEIGHGL